MKVSLIAKTYLLFRKSFLELKSGMKSLYDRKIILPAELNIQITHPYHDSYGCGFLDMRQSYLGYQRCYLKLEGLVCQAQGSGYYLI